MTDTNDESTDFKSEMEQVIENSTSRINTEAIPETSQSPREKYLEKGNPDQFNTPYRPARLFLAQYTADPNRSKATAETYDSRLNLYTEFVYEYSGKSPAEATQDDIIAFFIYLVEEYGRPKRTLDNFQSTISKLNGFLQVGDENPQVTAEEIKAIKTSNIANKKILYQREPLSRDEVKLMFENASKKRNKLILRILYETGCRNNDLSKLKIENINLDNKWVEFLNSKGGNDYKVPIRKELALKIEYYIRTVRKSYPTHDECDYLILSSQGGYLSTKRINSIVKDIAERAGIQEVLATHKMPPNHRMDQRKIHRVTPHTFRHSIVTHLSNDEIDKEVRKQLTGHQSDIIENYDHSENNSGFEELRQALDEN